MDTIDPEAVLIQKLQEIGKVDPSTLSRDRRLREDLNIDSLAMIDLAVAVEDATGIPLPDEDLEAAQTVGDLLDNLRRSQAKQ